MSLIRNIFSHPERLVCISSGTVSCCNPARAGHVLVLALQDRSRTIFFSFSSLKTEKVCKRVFSRDLAYISILHNDLCVNERDSETDCKRVAICIRSKIHIRRIHVH